MNHMLALVSQAEPLPQGMKKQKNNKTANLNEQNALPENENTITKRRQTKNLQGHFVSTQVVVSFYTYV